MSNAGTASGSGQITGLPFTATGAYNSIGASVNSFPMREDGVTGNLYQGVVRAGLAYVSCWSLINGAMGWGNGYNYVFSFFYKVA